MIQPFKCKKCENYWEEIINVKSDSDFDKLRDACKCPECGSKSKEKIIGVPSFKFANPVGTDRYNNSHDYRFKHKTEDAAAQRAHALSKEKDGEDPYKHDPSNNNKDVESGKYFGKVK